MSDFLLWADWLGRLLAQAASKPAGDKNGGGGGLFDGSSGMMFMVMATLVLMYFLLMRPESKKRKEQEKLLAGLKANDHVVTIGGICGVVVNATPDSSYVTIRVDDKTGTKLRMLRSAISRVGTPDEAAEDEAKEAK